MNKAQQLIINNEVLDAVNRYNDSKDSDVLYNGTQLRTCSARVYETPDYYVLRSYATIIAFIDKEAHIGYDFLRYVYGYTSTSAQHIAKFFSDYGAHSRRTYYSI